MMTVYLVLEGHARLPAGYVAAVGPDEEHVCVVLSHREPRRVIADVLDDREHVEVTEKGYYLLDGHRRLPGGYHAFDADDSRAALFHMDTGTALMDLFGDPDHLKILARDEEATRLAATLPAEVAS